MPFLVYVIALAIAAGTLALSVNLATAPDFKPVGQQQTANADVRQIPVNKRSDVSRGDPQNQLTPIYPAAPKTDGPPSSEVADAKPKEDGAAKPVAETTGTAAKDDENPDRSNVAAASTAASTAASDSGAPNSCAIAACSNAYRSFRASDCTYQPFEGPRKMCELTAGDRQSAGAAPASSPSRVGAVSRNRMQRRVGEFDDGERVLRRLPARGGYYRERDDRIVVMERPDFGFERRPVIIYRER